MNLNRMKSTHGRLAGKPVKPPVHEEFFDDQPHITVQDQIESLRNKIALKERYTKVLAEDFEESRQGASDVLLELYSETRELRVRLMTALEAENKAVQRALRTQITYQLALAGAGPTKAIPWLEEKVFNAAKDLNSMLLILHEKRKTMEDSERMVTMIHKWPRPGTLPWEIEAFQKFQVLERKIETVRVKRETAYILNAKYYEIKHTLRHEKAKYSPSLCLIENQLQLQKNELQGLKNMLKEAIMFRDSAYKNLIETENEAAVNRRARRKQMTKMKKTANMILAENHSKFVKTENNPRLVAFEEDNIVDEQNLQVGKVNDMLIEKRMKVEACEVRAKEIVDAMRVHNLTKVPKRYRTVKSLNLLLSEDKLMMVRVRDDMIKKRDHLLLISSHCQFAGSKIQEESQRRIEKYAGKISSTTEEIEDVEKKLYEYGDTIVTLRLGTQAVLAKLDKTLRFKPKGRDADLKSQLKSALLKVKTLVQEVSDYEDMFKEKKSEKSFAHIAHSTTTMTSFRFVRAGGPMVDEIEDSEDEDELPDSRVPGRMEIKARGQRVKQHAILRRGLK